MIRATAIFRPRSDIGRFVETNVTPAVRKSVEEVCQMVEKRAKALCPVDTGALQASISTEIEELAKTIRGSVAPDTDYAAYVEFGTGIAGAASAGAGEGPYSPTWPGMVAQPYMRPAVDEVKPKAEEIFRSNIGVAIET